MDNVKEIKRVITCGARWGSTANSYADLMTANGVCILASEHGSIELFRSIEEGDLIALKDGRNIIALGKPVLNKDRKALINQNKKWKDFFQFSLDLKLSQEELEDKANYFDFALGDEIDVITIEEWIMLDTPIYYPLVQGTVTIQDEYVKQECINKFRELSASAGEYETRQIEYLLNDAKKMFSEYMVLPDNFVEKAILSEELLKTINSVLKYDPENEMATKLKDSIAEKDKLLETKIEKLADTYNKKADSLKESNCRYIYFFIVILLSFAIISFNHVVTFDINSITRDNLIVFIVTKGFIASSMILSVFWIARFLNKRIHENVYLIEEYEYKALIFNSLQNLKDVFGKDNADEVFKNIIEKIIENPAVNLIKIKDKKSDISLANIKEITETLNEAKKVVNP